MQYLPVSESYIAQQGWLDSLTYSHNMPIFGFNYYSCIRLIMHNIYSSYEQ